MKEADIRKYAELMRELGLTGLEITEDNKAVRLERMTATTPGGDKTAASPAPEASGTTPARTDDSTITSPLVGVFYAAPAENAPPYVVVGDQVKKGMTLCVIEAMKLINEICAEHDGVITEICVTNGQVVEYGTELFRIRRPS